MVALLPLFIQVLPELFKLAEDVPAVFAYLNKSKETFAQAGEWTDEADAAFSAELDALEANPPVWWKTEGK